MSPKWFTTCHAADYCGYRGGSVIGEAVRRVDLVPDGRRGTTLTSRQGLELNALSD